MFETAKLPLAQQYKLCQLFCFKFFSNIHITMYAFIAKIYLNIYQENHFLGAINNKFSMLANDP